MGRINHRHTFRAGTVILTLAYLALLITWAYATPTFRSPDEPMHYNSVMRVMNGEGWPPPGEAPIDDSVLTIAQEGGLVHPAATDLEWGTFTTLPGGLIVGTGDLYSVINPLPEEQRIIPTFGGGTFGVDHMTQHPPAYYGIAAGTLSLLGADDWQWDGQILALRILSALMVMWVVPCAIYTARRIGLSEPHALLAGGAVFAIPQLAHIGSSITNDSLYILLGALVTAMSAKVLTTTPTPRHIMILGVLLGLGLWTKATFLIFGLIVGLAFLLSRGALAVRTKLLYGIAAGLLGVAIGGYWWVRNVVLYGTLQPAGYPTEAKDWQGEQPSVTEFLSTASHDLVGSFWGKFGWLELPLPATMVTVLVIVSTLMLIGGFLAAKGQRVTLLVLIGFVPLTVLVLGVQGWMNYVHTGNVAGMQGRYLFPAVAGLSALSIWAIAGLDRISSHLRRIIHGVVGLAMPATGLLGLWWMLHAAYRDDNALLGFNWMRWDAWSIASGSTLKIWVALTVVMVLSVVMINVAGAYYTTDDPEGSTGSELGHPHTIGADQRASESTMNRSGMAESEIGKHSSEYSDSGTTLGQGSDATGPNPSRS